MKIGATSSPAAAKTKGAQEAAGSSVQLSSAAAGLLNAASTPEFDTAKVERIHQAIADGGFKIDAEAIADKLIANAQEVLGALRR